MQESVHSGGGDDGVNANLLCKWVLRGGKNGSSAPAAVATPKEEFIALPLMAGAAPVADIRIELRPRAAKVTIVRPAQGAAKCAAWLNRTP